MKRKFPLLISTLSIVALAFIISSFSNEENKDTYWYTSKNIKGYISIQKVNSLLKDSIETTTVNTVVNAKFEKKTINFKLSTNSYGTKMVEPFKLTFSGLMDTNIKPVNFIGTLLKGEKDRASFWNFKGDFIEDMVNDPEARQFIDSEHTATIRMPRRTIPSFNIWAIVTNLPFNSEGTFKFNLLDETKLYVKKNQTINYLGKHKATINGKEMLLHKFVQQGRRMDPTYYWVNDEKVLVQVLLDNEFTFTLTTKEKALKSN